HGEVRVAPRAARAQLGLPRDRPVGERRGDRRDPRRQRAVRLLPRRGVARELAVPALRRLARAQRVRAGRASSVCALTARPARDPDRPLGYLLRLTTTSSELPSRSITSSVLSRAARSLFSASSAPSTGLRSTSLITSPTSRPALSPGPPG